MSSRRPAHRLPALVAGLVLLAGLGLSAPAGATTVPASGVRIGAKLTDINGASDVLLAIYFSDLSGCQNAVPAVGDVARDGFGGSTYTIPATATATSNSQKISTQGLYVRFVENFDNFIDANCLGPVLEALPKVPFEAGVTATLSSSRGATWDGTTLSAGDKLTVSAGPVRPSSAALTYQWLDNGSPISGATTSSYAVPESKIGRSISVTVTGKADGYLDSAATSTPALTVTRPVTFTGALAVGSTLTGTPPTGLTDGDWIAGKTLQLCQLGFAQLGAGASITVPSAILAENAVGWYVAHRVTGNGLTVTGECQGPITLPAFTSPVEATVTGSATFGETLTAVGSGHVPATATLSYQWLRDGQAIQGATSPTYDLVADDVTHDISVTIVAAADGFADSTATSPTQKVAGRAFASPPSATISGTAAIDQVLTAVPEDSSPQADTLTGQWQRSTAAGVWEDIAGETATTHQTTDLDVGHQLRYVATAVRAGYVDTTGASPASVAIVGRDFTMPPTATVAGTSSVGQTLTVTVTDPVPAASTTGRWQRLVAGSWTDIPGATTSSYALVAADESTKVRYVATSTLLGYEDAVSTSDEIGPIAKGTFTPPAPTVSGEAQVGTRLTASIDASRLPAGATVKYGWRVVTPSDAQSCPVASVSSTTIPYVANQNPLAIGGGFVGVRLCAMAEISAPGYTTAYASSALSETVIKGVFTNVQVSVSGTRQVGLFLSANLSGTPTPASYSSFQWQRFSEGSWVDISGASSSTYLLTADDLEQTLRVQAIAKESGYDDSGLVTSGSVGGIGKGTFSMGDPTITGSGKVDAQLTCVAGNNAPIDPTFEWITSASPALVLHTGATYSPDGSVALQTIRCRVSGAKPGYDVATATQAIAITKADFTTAASATVSGLAKVGETLTATISNATPLQGQTAGQWQRMTPLGWSDIALATALTYVVTPDDLGAALRYVVTSQRTGYHDATSPSTPTASAIKGTFVTPSPTITGTARVNEQLTCASRPVDGVTYSYAWSRVGVLGVLDPAPVPLVSVGGAYTVAPADGDARLLCTVTASRTGYDDASGTATTATIELASFTSGLDVTTSGTAQVRETLTAIVTGTVNPTPGATRARWERRLGDGSWTDIDGATSTTYQAAAGDVGHQLRYAVTSTLLGYETRTDASPASVVVAPGVFSHVELAIEGTPRVGTPLSVSGLDAVTPSLTSVGASVTYAWYVGGSETPSGTGSTYTPDAVDVGKQVVVRVSITAPGYDASGAKLGRESRPVEPGALSTPVLLATAAPVVDVALTVSSTGAGGPTTYQWYVLGITGAQLIPGATSTTYTPTPDQVGRQLQLVATVSANGYTPSSTSLVVGPVAPGASRPVTATIAGTAGVGRTLTAAIAEALPGGVLVSWQWQADGVDLAGATSNSLPVGADLVGKVLTATATVTRPGYLTVSDVSDPTAPVSRLALEGLAVAIEGNAQVWSRLTAVVTQSVPPVPAAGLSWQWYADGVAIPAATGAVLRLLRDQVGARITVQVTGLVEGYETAVAMSERTAPVVGVPVEFKVARKTARPGESVVSRGSGYLPGDVVELKFGSRVLGTATADDNGRFEAGLVIPVDVKVFGDRRVKAVLGDLVRFDTVYVLRPDEVRPD